MSNTELPFFVVLNAGSGHEETERRCSTIKGEMAHAGRRCELELVDDPERLAEVAQRMARKAASSGGVLVAAGGDGTINTVAHQAVLNGCTFGVLPQGTFNYFGRTHGIPEDLADAVRALIHSRVQPVQIGMVNDRIFLVNASIGLYPKLLEARENDKRQFGRSRIVAIYSAIKTAMGRHRRLRIKLELDQSKVRRLRTATLFVGNNRLQMEQVGMQPLDEALQEGRLAAIAPRPVGKLAMLGMLLHGALGRLRETGNVVSFAFKRMRVSAPALSRRRKIKVATDGEVCEMALPLEFRVLEGQLALLVPETTVKEADRETAGWAGSPPTRPNGASAG